MEVTFSKFEKRSQVMALYEQGIAKREIGRRLNMHEASVRYVIKRFTQVNSTQDRPKSGRPKKVTPRVKRKMKALITKDPFATGKDIQAELETSGTSLSFQHVNRVLHDDLGLAPCRPAMKPRLDARIKKARLDFARKYLDWGFEEWKSVLFSDESHFLQFGNGQRIIRIPPGTRFEEQYTTLMVKHPLNHTVEHSLSQCHVDSPQLSKISGGAHYVLNNISPSQGSLNIYQFI